MNETNGGKLMALKKSDDRICNIGSDLNRVYEKMKGYM
jgi:hypothetical protein